MTEETTTNTFPVETEETSNSEMSSAVEDTASSCAQNSCCSTEKSSCAESSCCQKKNSLGLVAFILSIIGILLLISIFGAVLGIPLLILAFILSLIALCKPPRKKAVAALIISLLPLGTLAWLSCQLYTVMAVPVMDFVSRISVETSENPEWRVTFQSPGFDDFLEGRMESRMRATDWKALLMSGNVKDKLQIAVSYALNEAKLEIPEAVNTWMSLYGPLMDIQPLPEEIVLSPLANTTWVLQAFDDEEVVGEYFLAFTETDISTQFCNTIGGSYVWNGDDIEGTLDGAFFQTLMACMDEEKTVLESAFNLKWASVQIASTRMVGDNLQRLFITTTEGHTFLYASVANFPVVSDEGVEGAISPDELDILVETMYDSVSQDIEELLNALDESGV